MMTGRQLWIRGILFGALYAPTAIFVALISVFWLHDAAEGNYLMEISWRTVAIIPLALMMFVAPMGLVAGAICTAVYTHWQQSTMIRHGLSILGLAMGSAASLALSLADVSNFKPLVPIVFLGSVVGLIGGILFPLFVAPSGAPKHRSRRLQMVYLASGLVVSQAVLWAWWIRGTVILTAGNDAEANALIAEVHKAPPLGNRDPLNMYLGASSRSDCYYIRVYASPKRDSMATTDCIYFDSVTLEDSEVHLRWIDEQTLRVDFDQVSSMEGSVNSDGTFSWKTVHQ